MKLSSVTLIVLVCYICGEIYKLVFKTKIELYKYIPILTASIGGLIGVLMFVFGGNVILNAENIWSALEIGIISGAGATGSNQIIKKIINKGEKND